MEVEFIAIFEQMLWSPVYTLPLYLSMAMITLLHLRLHGLRSAMLFAYLCPHPLDQELREQT